MPIAALTGWLERWTGNRTHDRPSTLAYAQWIAAFEEPARRVAQQRIATLPQLPAVSVLGSNDQTYPHCESLPLSEAAHAQGDWLIWIPPGTTLAAGALDHFILGMQGEADLLYADEDTIDGEGRRSLPFLKPAWSPDLQLSLNYLGGALAFRRELAAGESFPALPIASVVQRARCIQRVPFIASHRAVNDSPETPRRVRYTVPSSPPRVSILIPSGGNLEVLQANLHALVAKTDYPEYELIVIDNSRHERIREFASAGVQGKPVRWLDRRQEPFHYSRLNNWAARQCDSPLLLFLNDDTAAITPDWVTAMVEHALRPEVGAVGAKLLYPDGRIQHAGVVMGLYGLCGHAFRGLNGSELHYFGLSDCVRNVSAVTAACLLTRAKVFHEVGGFDEERFPIAFNDVDLCLRIGERGYRILYIPHAALYHYEAFSKSAEQYHPHPHERAALKERWGRLIDDDPFYHPYLTRAREDYSLRSRSEG